MSTHFFTDFLILIAQFGPFFTINFPTPCIAANMSMRVRSSFVQSAGLRTISLHCNSLGILIAPSAHHNIVIQYAHVFVNLFHCVDFIFEKDFHTSHTIPSIAIKLPSHDHSHCHSQVFALLYDSLAAYAAVFLATKFPVAIPSFIHLFVLFARAHSFHTVNAHLAHAYASPPGTRLVAIVNHISLVQFIFGSAMSK